MADRIRNRPPETISPDARLTPDLGMSSFDHVELALRMEQAFWEVYEAAVSSNRTTTEVARLVCCKRLQVV